MYSGVSGLRNFQTKLDVIGNNIANVNTHGFKKGRVTFKDLFSQSAGGASAPGNGVGGTNPKQVGLGASLGSIDTIHTGGSLQTTLRELDLAIEGDGFFVVRQTDDANEPSYYTRNGVFYLDGEGNLVNSDGYFVLDVDGAIINIADPDTIKSLSIGKDGVITYLTDADPNPQTAGPIGVARFSNNDALEKIGQNLYTETPNSGEPNVVNPGTEGSGVIRSGTLEMSNVDLSEEFVEMIIAQRGLQANTRIITTSDEVLQELLNLKR